ncbi:MAG TPA: phosphatase PAP2 family protein [Acidimicrobiales bacterium]|nr:phosphatase PAP2 family protein [Acidimicrobiales bacterium]
MTESTEATTARPWGRLRWWRELVYILAFYSVYTVIRNTQGSASVSVERAFRNARSVIRIERALALFHEQAIQQAFLGHGWRPFLSLWDVFYGTAHFVITAVALIWMFRTMPKRYPLWRNTLAVTTALALIGFATFPLMPPRLLSTVDPRYHFVDTLRVVGGLWSFDSGAMQKVSNQYAAMPSLHFAWALWSTCVILPALQSNWRRALTLAYPGLTLFAIVVTANHYIIDAVGGAVALGAGFVVGSALTAAIDRRHRRRDRRDGTERHRVLVSAPAAEPGTADGAGHGPRQAEAADHVASPTSSFRASG